MKSALLSVPGVLLFSALQAQTSIVLHFEQRAGNAGFALENPFNSDEGYAYRPDRLQYYISEPMVIHDGGQTTPASNRYFLIDAGAAVDLDLGEMDVEQVEGVQFSIGVDSAHNHLDPAVYPVGHPLALQNPSMHWGWAGGYIFLAFEGKAGNNFEKDFDIQSIGDDVFKTVTVNAGAEVEGDTLVISLLADYNKLLEGIDISGGLSSHGNLGAAGLIMENIQNLVFSPYSATSTAEVLPGDAFSIAPNPACEGYGLARFDLPEGRDYRLVVSDLTGRMLSRQVITAGISSMQVETPGPGMYLVQLWSRDKPVATLKWVVVPN